MKERLSRALENMKKYKPASDFYNTIINQEGWDVTETLFVGDNLIDDVAGPKSIGMKAVLLDRKNKFVADNDIKPDYVISTLNELISIIHES